jgi:hypothetical protein
MSTEDLWEYRLKQLEDWKKEFVKENSEENKEMMSIIEGLSLKIRDLITKITTIVAVIIIVFNGISWYLTNKPKIEKEVSSKTYYSSADNGKASKRVKELEKELELYKKGTKK